MENSSSIHSVSYGSVPLSSFFENLIDKKVNQIALTHFENFVDILCSFISRAYSHRLIFRLLKANDLQQKAKEEAERVRNFRDGLLLFDHTTKSRVTIETYSSEGSEESFEGATKDQMIAIDRDEVMIDGKPVYFTTPTGLEAGLFSTQNGTKKVTVFNSNDYPDIVIIYEYRPKGELKAWFVVAQKTTQFWEKVGARAPLKPFKNIRDGFIAQPMNIQPNPRSANVNLSDAEIVGDMDDMEDMSDMGIKPENSKKSRPKMPNIFGQIRLMELFKEWGFEEAALKKIEEWDLEDEALKKNSDKNDRSEQV